MIEVEQLTKRYGSRVAVGGVSFKVKPGEIIGFLGPNGAGKSTTLRMLTGYLAPNQGSIRIAGIDAIAHPTEARQKIGYLPEAVPLYREMRVDEYLRYRAGLKGVARRDIAGRVDASLQMANITDVRRRIIGQLSKGYRSRVGIADALVADPPILILDEPTAGLDPNQIRQVRDMIRGMAGQKTVLLSTHILPEVESTCERVLIIHRGKLVGEGTPGNLQRGDASAQTLVIEARSELDKARELFSKVAGVRRVSDAIVLPESPDLIRITLEADHTNVAERVFQAAAEGGVVLRELRREQTSLEDVFASLTTTEASAGDRPSESDATDAAEEADSSAPPTGESAASASDKEGT